jgi:hypothetical protein
VNDEGQLVDGGLMGAQTHKAFEVTCRCVFIAAIAPAFPTIITTTTTTQALMLRIFPTSE